MTFLTFWPWLKSKFTKMDAYSYYSRPYGHFDVSVGQICWLWSPTLFWTPLSARSKQILHTTAPRQLSGAAIYEKRSGWTKVNIFHLHYHLNIGRQKSIFFLYFFLFTSIMDTGWFWKPKHIEKIAQNEKKWKILQFIFEKKKVLLKDALIHNVEKYKLET